MRFTPLSLLLTIQISTWCVLGAWVHGWQLLCYPAAWVVIAAVFYGLNVAYDRKHGKPGQEPVTHSVPVHELSIPARHRRLETAPVGYMSPPRTAIEEC